MIIKERILGIGSPILDILATATEEFLASVPGAKGGMQLVGAAELDALISRIPAEPVIAPGGSAGNTIFGLAKLGVKTAFLGRVGDDCDGEFYRERLLELGGDSGSFTIDATLHTGRCLSIVTPDSERTMRTDLGAAAAIALEHIHPNHFTGISHCHIEGYMLFNSPVALKALRLAKAANCTVSLDLASFEVVKAQRQTLPALLREYVDIVFANEDEAAAFCDSRDEEEQAAALADCCPLAAVKLGRNGCILRAEGKTFRVPAQLVNAVDTTGAGDLWQAGFLYGLLKGRPLDECGRYGALLGAEVVQVMGATIPEHRWPSIKKIMR